MGFGGLLAILLAVSILSVVFLTLYSHTLERLFRENYDSVAYCNSMKQSIDQLNLRAQGTIWSDPTASTLDAGSASQGFAENLDRELHNCTLPGELDHALALAGQWKNYNGMLTVFDAAAPADRSHLYRGQMLPEYSGMTQTLQWIADANIQNMVSVDGKVKRTLTGVRNAVLLLVIVGSIAAAAVVGVVGASILQPLRELTLSAGQIEAGNLDQNLRVGSADEIGRLAAAFNSMTARLREFRRLDHDRLVRTQLTTQVAIDSLPDAVFTVGPGGVIEISNRTASEHFGIEPGASASALSQKLRWLTPLYEAARSGKPAPEAQGYQSAIQLFDAGDERFLLPRAVPMTAADKTPIGVCIILVDITRLRQADEAKSGVVATVSHELRTPLTSIRMALALLCGDKFGPLSAKQSALVTAAREESDRLYRIIENLMSISRMESGRAQFDFSPMEPAAIIAQAVDPMRAAFAEKKIRLDISAAPQLPRVSADAVAIGSALTNLLSNALKYTPSGGAVRVGAEPRDGFVAFVVSDDGPGIPEEFAPRVFDKFFRVPMPEGPTGAGLGLAIAKEVVEAHRGTISVCSSPPQGSRFTFTLPNAIAPV
jgi:signal transduction histidine kinase